MYFIFKKINELNFKKIFWNGVYEKGMLQQIQNIIQWVKVDHAWIRYTNTVLR